MRRKKFYVSKHAGQYVSGALYGIDLNRMQIIAHLKEAPIG